MEIAVFQSFTSIAYLPTNKETVSKTESGVQRILLEQNSSMQYMKPIFQFEKLVVNLKVESSFESHANVKEMRFTFSTKNLPPRLNLWDFDVRFVQKNQQMYREM